MANKIGLVAAQRTLLGIIASVESGLTAPTDAVTELAALKAQAPEGFEANYSVEDFERVRANYVSQFETSTDDIELDGCEEEAFEKSYESSY